MSTQVPAFTMYQDPLAWLIGVEGIALLDAWAGHHDREFTEARLAEIRRLLDEWGGARGLPERLIIGKR